MLRKRRSWRRKTLLIKCVENLWKFQTVEEVVFILLLKCFAFLAQYFFFNRIADSDLFHNIFREMCLKRHMNILSSLCCLVFTNLSLVSISFFLTDYFHFRMLTKLTMLTILGLMVPGWYYECNGFAIGLRPMEFRFWPSCQIDFVDQQSQLHCRSTHLSSNKSNTPN